MDEKDIGKVVCVEANDKNKIKDNWFPGLIVAPTSQSSVRINIAEDYLVRSFKDGKYYKAPKKEITEFTKEIGARVEKPTLKTAVEKALFFLDKDELPPHWDRDLLFGVDKIYIATATKEFKSGNSDEESIEEKDHFVAQLFKFMDDRGTPLNQAPVINEKDVDLYKLFKVVNTCGGYNKVNKAKLWEFVANKAGHEQQSFYSVKQCYQQYLHNFEYFNRKLGCTMMSHPRGVSSRSRFSRNIIRDVDKALPRTSSMTDKTRCAKNELNDKKNKDSGITKKTSKIIKAEEILLKKDDIKKDFANRTSHNKLSMKYDSGITETKDLVRNPKTKKEIKEILKKEIKEEIESDTVDDDQIIEEKTAEKKMYTRKLFGKSLSKTYKKEKVVKVKFVNTRLPGMRKMRAVKEQIKTFVKEIVPIKRSKRGASYTQQDASNKEKPNEEVPKLTRSKTKEDLHSKFKRVSLLNEFAGSASEKKKTPKKQKNRKKEKAASKDIIPTPINIENVPFDKNSPLAVGDNLVVYYGDKHATTYDAKVINMCDIEGVMKYYVHYKGWNSRYDEWIDVMRIAEKKKDPEPGPEVDNDADFSKISPSEQNNVDPKNVPSTTNKTRTSITPLSSNSNIKKSSYSIARPTRSCTLTNRPLFYIDSSDSEEEYTAVVGPSKQYSKKKVIKSELGVIKTTEPLDTDHQKKTINPKTYPSTEVLMRQSTIRKPKSSMLNINNIKSEEVEVCEHPPVDLNFVMQLPSGSIKPNADNENIEATIAPNHYLSPKEIPERNYLEHMSESSKSGNEETRIKFEPLTIPTKSETSISEDVEQNQLKKITDVISPLLDDKSNESRMSGTDFYVNKIRSEIKGLKSTSTNSNNDIIQNTESFVLDQQIKIKVPKMNEPVSDDVNEFKESESCNFDTISSITEEKFGRSIKYDSPKLCNLENSDELPRDIDSSAQEEVVEQNRLIIPFVPDNNNIYSSVNIAKIGVYENLNVINKIEDLTKINRSNNEFHKFQNLMIGDVPVVTSNIEKIEQHFQDKVNVSDLKYEVLDLCMKPTELPPANIFRTLEPHELNYMIIEEEDDDDDDDELKLVIAENDKIETDDQMDSNLVIREEHNSFDGQIDKNIETQYLPSLPPKTHTNIELECIHSSPVKRDISVLEDTDDEITTYFDESMQTALIQSYKYFPDFENHSSQNVLYMDNIDDNTKSGFDSNSKLPTIRNKEIIESATKLNNNPLNNDKSKKCDFIKNVNDNNEKEKTMVPPKLLCTEEIIDENTFNNSIEYNRKAVENDIYKPSTSKGFFDSIHQPGTSKDSFYKIYTSYDAKNHFSEAAQALKSVTFDANVPGKSSFYENSLPSTSKSFYENSLPSTSKSFYENSMPSTSKSFYENSLPSTSKSFYNLESDKSSILFCEETIPGSPTCTSEKQYDQEERKKNLQEEREAASAMYAMKQSFSRPMITLLGATEEEMEEYTKIFENDGAILDQQHLQFLAKISSRNLDKDINEPSVAEPLDKEPATIIEKIVKPLENPQSKRKINSHEKPSRRSKLSTTTAPIPSGSSVEKPVGDIMQPPVIDGNPMFVYTPEMNSQQRQSLILNAMDTLREQYAVINSLATANLEQMKIIKKKKKKKARAAKAAARAAAKAAAKDQSQSTNGAGTSK